MAKALLQTFSINTFGTGVTRYTPLASVGHIVGATETEHQTLFRSTGVISLFTLLVPSNNLTGTSTIRIRKNAGNGNSSISVGASATGLFYDLVNTETVAAGDKFAYEYGLSAGGSDFWQGVASCVYNADDKTVMRASVSSAVASTAVDSTTRYNVPVGNASWQLSETFQQATLRVAGTLKNMFVIVTANTRITATIFGTRINTADGNVAISVGAGVTGFIEDTTHSDTIASGDIVNYRRTTSTGGGSISFSDNGMEIVTVDRTSMMITGSPGGMATNFGTTTYCGMSGALSSFSEGYTNAPATLLQRVSNLTCYVSANTLNAGTTTLKMRKNTANANQVVSIGFGVTGVITDATGVDVLLPADRSALQLITSGASGAMTMNWTTMKVKYLDRKEMIGPGIVPVGR